MTLEPLLYIGQTVSWDTSSERLQGKSRPEVDLGEDDEGREGREDHERDALRVWGLGFRV